MKKVVEEWETLKAIGMVCEHELEDGSRIMLMKLWEDIYVTPDGLKLYRCRMILPGKCQCRYDDYFTELWQKMQSGEIRFI